MARPPAKELTDRELDVMHVYWRTAAATAQEARDALAAAGIDLTYTTVATLVRILSEKGFLTATNAERPFRYRATRPYEEVSGRLLDDLVAKVFRGSRKQLLLRLMDDQPLGARERAVLEKILGGLEP
jgi:BlaI family penicillinase repressor